VSKHGVVALSEDLHFALAEQESKVKVSVLCPGYVRTRILDAQRNRPSDLPNDGWKASDITSGREAIERGTPPSEVADHVLRAIAEERFYILPHAEFDEYIRVRMENILHRQRRRCHGRFWGGVAGARRWQRNAAATRGYGGPERHPARLAQPPA
jgi:short-subunit dehydrogenase